MRQSPIQPSNSFVPMPLSTLESRYERGWRWSGEHVPKIVAGAHDGAERAEARVEAVVDPSAVLLERVGVHLGESAGAAEAAAEHAVHGGAGISPARLDPVDGLAHPTNDLSPATYFQHSQQAPASPPQSGGDTVRGSANEIRGGIAYPWRRSRGPCRRCDRRRQPCSRRPTCCGVEAASTMMARENG